MRRPEGPSLRLALGSLTKELAAAGIESPASEAARLLAAATGIPGPRLALHLDEALDPDHGRVLARLIGRRSSGEPLQYVEGTAEFRSLTLKADPRALIPRPETEQLIQRVADRLRAPSRPAAASGVRSVARPALGTAGRQDPPVRRALDIGTGSGAIALSLIAEELADCAVGIDRSTTALEQATENMELNGLDSSRIEFRLCGDDPYGAVKPRESFDLLVSNPPYVARAELDGLPAEIVEWEPIEALDGGEDGLDVLRRVVSGAQKHVESGGWLFLEFGATQGSAVAEMLLDGPWRDVRLLSDLAGRERFVEARRD